MAPGRLRPSTSSFPKGECEFVREYTLPFTLLVVADLLGVPEEDRGDVCVTRLVD